ncbi:NAD(P)H-dependent oxidoreductase [Bifidobacterium sp. ESL0798]|uniref:NAD(P)H-dependent oxidoreductase n=1 Tax=Bifidobacterium sp. ESL0798 TaxID=2983235 RepID=UPI0023F6C4A7|nr:NAD(P)H-dependent oxidoreductase [Bifidobacterium sp. ESL0798]WEV74430.1 NAD(P)H-dependent oxidoreductase [Bifidobacterium sp. ESL0798]
MNILVIQGSPDPASMSAKLAQAYTDKARQAGHDVEAIDLSHEPNFDPVLRFGYRRHMADETLPNRWQEQIRQAHHLAFFFPIWWTAEPSILKGWVERVLTPHFAYRHEQGKLMETGLLGGRTASITTSCQGPAAYVRMPGGVITRWKYFILGNCGIKLIHTDVLGRMDSTKDTPKRREAFERRVLANMPKAC